jgi:hypothetical protein
MSSSHVRSCPESGPASTAMLGLIKRTGDRLVEEGLAHCLWKGGGESARWGSGRGDIDLLVGGGSWPALRSLLGELGFREAGSTSFIGPDTSAYLPQAGSGPALESPVPVAVGRGDAGLRDARAGVR